MARLTARRGMCTFLVLCITTVAAAPAVRAQTATEVKVERVKPKLPKHETMRFLRENRDFLRARLDLLRASRVERAGKGDALDPRFLAYRELLADALAAEDSVAGAADAHARRDLLDRIARLGELEGDLDAMDSLLAAQRTRLARLHEDFTGRQETALVILLRGHPASGPPAELSITLEDSTVVRAPLTAEQRAALAQGGIAELYHGFVEPRTQLIALAVTPGGGRAREEGWVTLEPGRDRLTFLEFDLSALDAADPAARLRAGTWQHSPDVAAAGR